MNSLNPQYVAKQVEQAAQQQWAERNAYLTTEDPSRPKFYACSMLPYPSGKLHMGHVRNYTITDVLARQLRMRGFNVLNPMGWDAFGLPAENAAMKNKLPPAQWTYDNIATMRGQMQALGLALDWSREVTTCKPDYYKWNQWFFLKMLEKGICERRTQVVNWDPVDQTVLANEQVIDGRGWRSGALVEKREIPGYYLKITQYAEELLEQVQQHLPGWPERVRLMQENWIGKSEGVRFAFAHDLRDANGQLVQDGKMYVFTTRPDTIMGVTFCAVAPEHPLANLAAARKPELAAFIEACQKGGNTEAELALREKEGRPTGLFVTHPLNGQQVEVWIGNYVLMSYGDGAVMGVPAHDERDFAFANKYNIPIQQVIAVQGEVFDSKVWADWYADKQRGTCIHSGPLDGLNCTQALQEVANLLAAKGLGEKKTTWRLRDWGISRQRYWGTPIPIIHCPSCGVVPVPEQDLPVVLPEHLIPDGSGNPLHKCESFLQVACPTCGGAAKRETDTMDTFVDSSWYFMRYCDAHNQQAMVGAGTRYWMPMDQYIGGIEHAILHLLYARFWTKVMRDMGLVEVGEPFTKLLTQGMVLNHIYSRRTEQGGVEYFWPHEVDNIHDEHGKIIGAKRKVDGSLVNYDGVGTMSKSKNNGVDPQALIDQYGADTARLFSIFAAPPEQTMEWNDAAVEGAHRFLRRVWQFAHKHPQLGQVSPASATELSAQDKKLRRELHVVLKQIHFDFERLQYNTVVSGAMKLLNALEAAQNCHASVYQEGFGILLRVLYPVVPHITAVLWQETGFAKQGWILDAPWPAVDPQALLTDELELILQINGKLRGKLLVAAGLDAKAIEQQALQSEEFLRFANGQSAKRVIVVPGRLVNIVL